MRKEIKKSSIQAKLVLANIIEICTYIDIDIDIDIELSDNGNTH